MYKILACTPHTLEENIQALKREILESVDATQRKALKKNYTGCMQRKKN